MSFLDMEENAKKQHDLPLGAVVIYEDEDDGDRVRMVVTAHSRDCDMTPLYMISKAPIEYPNPEPGMFSPDYLWHRFYAEWHIGNVSHDSLRDTGERVGLMPLPPLSR